MENASKALLIAGGVLIAILVASLGVYFSRSMADDVAEFYAKLEENKRTEFNQQFLNFDSSSINIQDIVTIINLAKDSNKENDLEETTPPTDPFNDNSLYVTVESKYDDGTGNGIGGISKDRCKHLEKFTNDDINSAINYEMSKVNPPQFSCTVHINANTGYVNYIEIGN